MTTQAFQSGRVPPRPDPSADGLGLQVLLYLAGMVLLWTLLCAVSHLAPDLDGLEELVWASSLELGYTKHPPAPSWLMYFLTQLMGRPVWLPFFAGQLMSVLALWFLWLLGREFTTPRKAFMAVLLVSVSIYFSLRGTIYNHNTAQLWSVAAGTWLLYRALKFQRLSSWAWLGLVAGLSIQTKYSAVIQFTAYFLFMLRQGSFRDTRTLKGVALALLTFAVTVTPHLYWLAANAFMPLRYADNSLEAGGHVQALKHLLSFALDQLARLSPMLLAWLAWHVWDKRSRGPQTPAPTRYGAQFTAWDRSFLLWIGLVPALSTMLVSAVLGTRLVASWGTTFFMLYGFYLLWWMHGDERTNLRRIAILCIAIQVLMAVGYALARGPLAWHTGRDSRSTFPGAVISQHMNDIWQQHVPQVPLTLVASDTWLGGNIAIHQGMHAHVFINGKLEESPWLDESAPLACGALVVYSLQTRSEPDPVLTSLHDSASVQGRLEIPWSSGKSPLIDLNWGIIPPGEQCALVPGR